MKRIYCVTLTSGHYSGDSAPVAIEGAYTDLDLAIKHVSEAASRHFQWIDPSVIAEDTGVGVAIAYDYNQPVWIVSRQVKARRSYEEPIANIETVTVDGLEYQRTTVSKTIRHRDELHMFAARIKAKGFLVDNDDDGMASAGIAEEQFDAQDAKLATKHKKETP